MLGCPKGGRQMQQDWESGVLRAAGFPIKIA